MNKKNLNKGLKEAADAFIAEIMAIITSAAATATLGDILHTPLERTVVLSEEQWKLLDQRVEQLITLRYGLEPAVLEDAGIRYIGQLVQRSPNELIQLMDGSQLRGIRDQLGKHGLFVGMAISGWTPPPLVSSPPTPPPALAPKQLSEADHKLIELFDKLVEELELSVRATNCLLNARMHCIGEVVQRTEDEMLKTKNFGRKQLREIKEILALISLGLGMKAEVERLGWTLEGAKARNEVRERAT